MLKILSDKLNLFFMCVLLAWISFLPNNIQEYYRSYFFMILAAFLLNTLTQKNMNLKVYFFKKTDLAVWLYLFMISFGVWNSTNTLVSVEFYRNFALFAVLIYFPLKNYVDLRNLRRVLFFLCLFHILRRRGILAGSLVINCY